MTRERTARQPAGPGRTARRPRSRAGAAPLASAAPAPAGRAKSPGRPGPPRFRDVGFTRRALVLLGVVAILALSYANSLRIMLSQQRDMATANAQIAERTARLAELDAQLERWRDPAYVKNQARAQLGWVLPGETGYRVIGTDGKVVDVGSPTAAIAGGSTLDHTRWWDRLASSVAAADRPAAKG